jgi:hypothetical protein
VLENVLVSSGGKVNNTKSKIYGWNILGQHQDAIYRIFVFPLIVSWKFFKYYGIPIFLKSSSSQAWKEILDKLAGRIQIWGA